MKIELLRVTIQPLLTKRMNYEDLKAILRHLKDMMKCTKCDTRFRDKNITILATIPAEGLFQLYCQKCNHSMLVNIAIPAEGEGHTISKESITANEILDMRNFLKNFNGDFKKLFK